MLEAIVGPGWTINRLTGSIGAEISGPDIRQFDPQSAASLLDILDECGVIFMRGQSKDPRDLADFAAMFGPVLPAHPMKPGLPGIPSVLGNETGHVSASDAQCRDIHNRQGTNWHVDCTFMPRLPALSLLQAAVVPAYGGDTLFSDLRGAYDTLSAPLRRLVDELHCRHDARKLYPEWLQPGADPVLRERLVSAEPVTHPLVIDDARTGRKSLLLNPNCITEIVGLSQLESDTLLSLLTTHTLIPERTVRWRWAEGDVAIWSNPRLLHNYVLDHGAVERRIYRAMVDQKS
ncbi:TauD/TfdA family dioxygenase [Streptomyces sp. PRKS01-29]|nr:TauD/TfdA family dioxygenase [Streptomyces sabulosicollis]MBI0293368.1 TauD/TfdA family dioxygenase [Streptomyces sabulosicollis]